VSEIQGALEFRIQGTKKGELKVEHQENVASEKLHTWKVFPREQDVINPVCQL
jgi:hypothetical protein